MYRNFCILILYVLPGIAFAQRDAFVVVQGGQQAAIAISTRATPVEVYAAGELQRVVSLMTGTTLEIKTGDTGIVIGTPATNAAVEKNAAMLKLSGAGEEQIAVARIGHSLYLAGNTPRAALYATYTFLQQVLGVRWLWPGTSGEFIPVKNNIVIDELFLSETPALPLRSLAITGTRNGDPDTDTWMARNRMNNISIPAAADPNDEKSIARRKKGFLAHISGHNLVLPDSLLQAHSEYIAEYGGKREFRPGGGLQLCWSNTGVQDAIVKMMAAWWDKNPYLDAIHFYPADNQRYCQCAQCRAMGDVSTRWQKFSTAIIAELEKTHPGKKYWTYAYQGYKAVPQTIPAPFTYIGYTLYDASYRHFLSGGSHYNQLPIHEIEGWLDKGAHLGIRGYEFIIFKDPLFVPSVSWVVDEIAWIKNKGLIAYASELPAYGAPAHALPENTSWNCSRMSLYAVAQTMWKSELTADSLVKDWCHTVYGPAAAFMQAYYWEMDSAWRKAPGKIGLYTNSPAPEVDKFLSTKLFDRAGNYFTAARTAIASISDSTKHNRIDDQIMLEQKMLLNWLQVYRYKKGIAGRYKATVIKEGSTQLSAGLSMSWTDQSLLINSALQGDSVLICIQPDVNRSALVQLPLKNELQIPFATLGIKPKDSLQFKMAISTGMHSAWPEASSFNPLNFATVMLVNKKSDNPAKKVILYDAGVDGGNLSVEFQQKGWEVASGITAEKELQEKLREDAGSLLLRYDSSHWRLTDAFISKEIGAYLKKGRVVVITATRDLPVHKWFDVPAVKWTGNNNTPIRRASSVSPASWFEGPNSIASIFEKGLTPQSAFIPLKDGWNAIAKINLKNGTAAPFLLTKQIGKGLLVLTTSFMGYDGGYELFGSRNMENVVKLFTNLEAFQQRSSTK